MKEKELKYFRSESIILNRSEIELADYNPRTISSQAKAELKRGIKNFGLVGGLLVNYRDGKYILVSGHQRVAVMDELMHFPEVDYQLRVDKICESEKREKELNILLNNHNAQGDWDMDLLRDVLVDIDYKMAGLTEEDLNLIGVDVFLDTPQIKEINNELEYLTRPELKSDLQDETAEIDFDRRKEHMKDVKRQVREKACQTAQNMEAYVVLSFDNMRDKEAFCVRFGYDRGVKYIKGEIFSEQVERVE